MTTHRFAPTRWHNVLGTFPPALVVQSGDTIVTETINAWGFDKTGARLAGEPNPMNGPIAVEGAEPGNALLVEILDMQPLRPLAGPGRCSRPTSSIQTLPAMC